MSALRTLAGQTAIYGLSSIVARFINFLLTPLYTSKGVFPPEEYGVITAFYAWAAFLTVLLTFGMETTFFRFANRKELDTKRAYGTAFYAVAFIALPFIFMSVLFNDGIASAMRYPEHGNLVWMLALALGLDAMTAIPMARLRHEGRPWRFVAVNMSNIGITVALSLYFFAYRMPHDPSINVSYVFLINLVASGVKFLLLVPQWPRFAQFDRALLKPMRAFAWPLAIAGLAGMVNETADRAVLKYLLPADTADAQIGIYGACYKLAVIITLFIQAFRMGAEPFFFSHAKEKNSKQTFARIMNLFVAVCMAAFLTVMLFIDVFKWFIPNPAYHEGLRVVPILMLANVFLGIYYNQSVWYKLTDRTKAGSTISLIGAGITLLLLFTLVPRFGYMGAAWATLICYVTMAAISYAWGQRHYPVPYNVSRVLLYMAGAVALWWGSEQLPFEGILGYLIRLVLLSVYVMAVWLKERSTLRPLSA
ncbi:MAG: oligosaccharide flippase family protein [Flavobacteriales bacterium]|nr:oligosaccharide flippase family protein [Flavobacteriales bacterium]